VVHDLLKILKNILKQEQLMAERKFDKFFDFPDSSKYRVPIFEPKSFCFKNGKLKYVPQVLSPCHNIVEYNGKRQETYNVQNIHFLSRLIFQFLSHEPGTD